MSFTMLMVHYVPSEAQRTAPLEAWKHVALFIQSLEGLQWKYWLNDESDGSSGGAYLFDTPESAAYAKVQLLSSLEEAGASILSARTFQVDAEMSAMTRGVLGGN